MAGFAVPVYGSLNQVLLLVIIQFCSFMQKVFEKAFQDTGITVEHGRQFYARDGPVHRESNHRSRDHPMFDL